MGMNFDWFPRNHAFADTLAARGQLFLRQRRHGGRPTHHVGRITASRTAFLAKTVGRYANMAFTYFRFSSVAYPTTAHALLPTPRWRAHAALRAFLALRHYAIMTFCTPSRCFMMLV